MLEGPIALITSALLSKHILIQSSICNINVKVKWLALGSDILLSHRCRFQSVKEWYAVFPALARVRGAAGTVISKCQPATSGNEQWWGISLDSIPSVSLFWQRDCVCSTSLPIAPWTYRLFHYLKWGFESSQQTLPFPFYCFSNGPPAGLSCEITGHSFFWGLQV